MGAFHRVKAGMLTETEFNQQADRVLALIGDAVDASDSDSDWDISEGILTIETEGGRMVINRNTGMREIWLAGKRAAAHFKFSEGDWRDSRSADTLAVAVNRVFLEQAGEPLDWRLT
jgi:CyaY protein